MNFVIFIMTFTVGTVLVKQHGPCPHGAYFFHQITAVMVATKGRCMELEEPFLRLLMQSGVRESFDQVRLE